MNWRVPLADLDYGPAENQAVLDVLNSRWLTMGALTQHFEDQFAQQMGFSHAVAVSNGTVALHLACLSLGLGPGDQVIVPSLSFVATANAVLYTGAQVRFADIISPEELTISPAAIESALTPHTRAIIVMHYGGHPCRMPEIIQIARRHGLAVIEDCAHAPGARLQDRPLGAWGDVACFSFFSNKNLSTGEGGMFVTNREDLARRARLLRSHGMTSLTWDRHQGHAFSYDVLDLGYNYRLDEIRAALGIVQLSKLAANNASRQQLVHRYWRAFQGSGLLLPFHSAASQPGRLSAHHLFSLLLPHSRHRQPFMQALQQVGVQTSIHYPPIHRFTYYQSRCPSVALPLTEQVAARQVTLPLFPTMTSDQLDHVIQSVNHIIGSLWN